MCKKQVQATDYKSLGKCCKTYSGNASRTPSVQKRVRLSGLVHFTSSALGNRGPEKEAPTLGT